MNTPIINFGCHISHQLPMMQHFNIGKKMEVNPFENVNYVKLSNSFTPGYEKLKHFLNRKSESVTTRKINNEFVILYDIRHLDFITLIKWHSPDCGKFYMNEHSVHFRIEGDVLHC